MRFLSYGYTFIGFILLLWFYKLRGLHLVAGLPWPVWLLWMMDAAGESCDAWFAFSTNRLSAVRQQLIFTSTKHSETQECLGFVFQTCYLSSSDVFSLHFIQTCSFPALIGAV